MSKLEKFLKESKLSDDAKNLIREMWEDEKRSVAADIRNEMKERYMTDQKELVEGLNKLVTDTITENTQDLYNEKRRLVEDRIALRSSLGNFSKFANSIIAEEVKAMRDERTSLNEMMGKFVGFSNKVLAEEVSGLHEERQQLAESRVKLVSEGTRQITEAKQNFIRRAAESTAKFLEENQRELMSSLKESIVEAKQNRFGRKIFEAYQEEFGNKQYNENAIIRKMNESIEAKESLIADLNVRLTESKKAQDESARQIQIMEDAKVRNTIISELIKPLNAQQKNLMENLLESTPTNKLRDDFNKYHKSVLNETSTPKNRKVDNKATTQVPLNECKVHTGNRENLNESVDLDNDEMNFLKSIIKKAGI